jgi:hypothetical protein
MAFKKTKKQLISAFILFVIPLWFILMYENNLHCTQYTSFRIAFLDMQPHIEERWICNNEAPYVYQGLHAKLLRGYFGGTLLAHLFLPGILYFIMTEVKLTKVVIIFLVLSHGVLIMNAFIPRCVQGERILWLNIISLFFSSFLYIPLVVKLNCESPRIQRILGRACKKVRPVFLVLYLIGVWGISFIALLSSDM